MKFIVFSGLLFYIFITPVDPFSSERDFRISFEKVPTAVLLCVGGGGLCRLKSNPSANENQKEPKLPLESS